MRWHHRIIGVLAVGAAVAVAALLFAAFGPADALLMGTMAALLAGLYLLRRYARTVLLYRPHRRAPSTDAPVREQRHGDPSVRRHRVDVRRGSIAEDRQGSRATVAGRR